VKTRNIIYRSPSFSVVVPAVVCACVWLSYLL